jgi:hypothetical protein
LLSGWSSKASSQHRRLWTPACQRPSPAWLLPSDTCSDSVTDPDRNLEQAVCVEVDVVGNPRSVRDTLKVVGQSLAMGGKARGGYALSRDGTLDN